MISALIEDLLARRAVDPIALEDAVHALMCGEVAPAQAGGFLVALRTVEPERGMLAACARVLRAHRVAVRAQVRPLVDTCGTGGDRSGTFNISTAAALVVAAAGGAAAKHGNRGVSSRSGSADVIEALGCRLDLTPADARTLLEATGFVFLFAPVFHPAMAHVAPVRRALGIRTLFNLLGPLANPALAECQLMGVHDPALTRVMAETLRELGTVRGVVVHCAGLDEVGLHDVTRGFRLDDGAIEPFTLDPAELGVGRAPIEALRGGEPAENAAILRRVLDGEPGPRADVVALNAAVAMDVAGMVRDVAEGLERSRAALADGSAARCLSRYAASSRPVAEERVA